MSSTEVVHVPEMQEYIDDPTNEVFIPGVGKVDAAFLRINEEHLDQDLERQAAYYAYFSVAVADAMRDYAMAELNVKITWAEVRRGLKKSTKKMTIPDLDAALDESEEVVAAKMAAIDAKHRLSLTQAIMYALQQKKDMLSSKTGLRRTELEVHMKELGIKILTGGTYGKEKQ